MTAARGPAGGRRFRPAPAATIVTVAGLLLLTGLGVWQLQRLSWKTELIARITARMAAAPASAEAIGDLEPLEDWLYRRVAARGIFAYDKTILIARGRGFDVLTPLLRRDGRPLLVIRGRVEEADAPVGRPEDPALWGPVTIEAVVRPPQPAGPFTPKSKPGARIRYDEDPDAIAAALGIPAPVPAILVATAPVGEGLAPAMLPAPPRNPHLGYALTWFALAAALAAIYVRHGIMRAREA